VTFVNQKPEIAKSMEEKLFAYLAEIDAQMPVKNPSYDPDNPPSMEKMRGGDGRGKTGGGKGKKLGGGGKKKMRDESETLENLGPSSDDPDTPEKSGDGRHGKEGRQSRRKRQKAHDRLSPANQALRPLHQKLLYLPDRSPSRLRLPPRSM
jgi:hypothetical protein